MASLSRRAGLERWLVQPQPTDKNWRPDTPVSGGWAATSTPALTLDAQALGHNIEVMQRWVEDRGLLLAPHGKTTMSPALWSWQLEAGAWGITVANEAQLRVARAFSIPRVIVANEFVSPQGLTWLARELEDPEFSVTCWVDSVRGVELMSRALSRVGATRALSVCIELGAPGGRGGARDDRTVEQVMQAVLAAPTLHLAGVAGYEGSIPVTQEREKPEAVLAFVTRMAAVFEKVLPHIEADRPMLTAGGSAYFDLVAQVFEPLARRHPEVDVILRSGAYVVHDHGLYRRTTPSADREGPTFWPAASVWSRVVSVPEPSLALLDAGKRDLSYDAGLPEILEVFDADGLQRDLSDRPLVVETNDQHAFVTMANDALRVGDLVRLGLSHPCTILDKWRTALVMDSAQATVRIAGAVRTYF